MPLDITDMNAPKSDQLDAVDLTNDGRVFTITGVQRNNNADQPLNVHLDEFPRVWRPSKSMRRVLAYIWGTDAEQYIGRHVHLYTDPSVEFGGQRVGGVRIRAMSHMAKPMHAPLLIKKGRAGLFTVQPLKEQPRPQQAPDLITADQLKALQASLTEAGITQRDDALNFYEATVKRRVPASKDLTRDEASQVIDALKATVQPATDPDADHEEPPAEFWDQQDES